MDKEGDQGELPAALADLGLLVQALRGARGDVLAALSELQLAARPLFEAEMKGLERRFGQGDPRVGGLRAGLEQMEHRATRLAVAAELARVRIPQVAEEDTLLHGRVTDDALRGVPNVGVRLVDEAGRQVTGVQAVKTDPSGYYAFTLTPGIAARLAAKAVSIAVLSGREKVAPASLEPFRVTPGARIVKEAVLNTAELEELKLRVRTGTPGRGRGGRGPRGSR